MSQRNCNQRISPWSKRLACAALLVTLGAAPGALAQDKTNSEPTPGQVSTLTSQVSQEIESPYCPGKTLAMCPSGGAAEVRREVQELARQGKDKQAIKEAIIAKYGEEFRLVEPPSQDNYTLLAIIAGALLGALSAIWLLSARRKDVDPAKAAPDAESVDEDSSDEDLPDEDRAYLAELRSEYQD